MGQVKKGNRKLMFYFYSGVICGILIGVTALCVVVSYRIDAYYLEVCYLENTIQDKNARLALLENSVDTHNIVLEEIEVVLVYEGDEIDEIDEIDIVKSIKEKYSSLLGKEVERFDADILAEVIDKRIFVIEKRKYQLHVNKLILTEALKLWVEIEMIS